MSSKKYEDNGYDNDQDVMIIISCCARARAHHMPHIPEEID